MPQRTVPEASPTRPHPPRATVESARSLGETLAPRSREIEQLRRLPDDLVEALIDLGVFRMFVPERYGGHEQPVADALGVIEELAYWDGSVGWCAMIGATTGLQSAALPDEHARALYVDDPRAVTGGVAEPRGVARQVAGGLSVSGRWSWGSGAHHCRWIGGGCSIESDEAGPPRVVFAFFEREQVTLHDTWHTGGLRGTGSGDFEVRDAFVPEGRWVEAITAPRSDFDSPLYRFPFFGLLALGVSTVGLGLARRALDELRTLAATKRYVGSRRALAQRPMVQAAVGESEARREAARAFVESAVAAAWSQAGEGALGVEQRRRLRQAATFAMRSAVEVVRAMAEQAGGTAVFEECPLDRLLRDVHVAAAHGMVAPRTYELFGRLALGLETDASQL